MIFCKKSDEAKRITAVLKKAGLNIAPYHAGKHIRYSFI